MDGYQLTAAIIQSIASLGWPIAMVASIAIFHKRIAELMPRLQLKYKDLEASFRLEQAEKEAAALSPAVPSPEAQPTPEEQDKFAKLAALSPRAAMLEVRTAIEEALRARARAEGLLTDRVQSTLGLTRLLRSRGVIGNQTSALLDDLRVVGNRAAHDGQSSFSPQEAMQYKALADVLIAQLQSGAGDSA